MEKFIFCQRDTRRLLKMPKYNLTSFGMYIGNKIVKRFCCTYGKSAGLMYSFVCREIEYIRLFGMSVRYCLCFLSHVQIAIKRGLSVNKDLLVEILNQQTLIGQRRVYNFFSSLEVDIICIKFPQI